MVWFQKVSEGIRTNEQADTAEHKGVPRGVWQKCPSCHAVLYQPELVENLQVCPGCAHHFRLPMRARLAQLFDEGSMREIAQDIIPVDALKFVDTKAYAERLEAAQAKTGEADALVAAEGTLNGIPIVLTVFDFDFLGGSMGSVVGERFIRAIHHALAEKRPLLTCTASGGARMQESLFSLMQMAKISAGLGRLKAAGLPYIVILTDPTTGGVSASLAMLGDLHIAEPKALIGFAGPRVIEQTVRETLPVGFQRSEFLQEKGMVDMIVDRRELKAKLAGLLAKILHLPRDVPL